MKDVKLNPKETNIYSIVISAIDIKWDFLYDSDKLILKFKTSPDYLYIFCSMWKKLFKIKMNKNVLQLTMTNFNVNIQRSIMIEFWLKNKNCNVIRYYDRLLGGIKVFFLFSTLMQYSLFSAFVNSVIETQPHPSVYVLSMLSCDNGTAE